MADFAARLAALAHRLRAADIDASVDPRDINPPGVLVAGDAVLPLVKLSGDYRLRASVILFARDAGDADAYAALSDLYGQVVAVLGRDLDPDDAPFERAVLPDNPTALPTLRLTVTLT